MGSAVYSNLVDRFGSMRSGNTPPTSPSHPQNGFPSPQAPPVPPKDPYTTSSSSQTSSFSQSTSQTLQSYRRHILEPIISNDSLPERVDEYGRKAAPRLSVINPDVKDYGNEREEEEGQEKDGEGLGYELSDAYGGNGGGLSPSPSAKYALSEVSQKRVQEEGEMMSKFRREEAERERERTGYDINTAGAENINGVHGNGVGLSTGHLNGSERDGVENHYTVNGGNEKELEDADRGLAYDDPEPEHPIHNIAPGDATAKAEERGHEKRVSLGKLPSRFSLGAIIEPVSPSRLNHIQQSPIRDHFHSPDHRDLDGIPVTTSVHPPSHNSTPTTQTNRNAIENGGSGRFDDLDEGDGDEGEFGLCIVKDYALGAVWDEDGSRRFTGIANPGTINDEHLAKNGVPLDNERGQDMQPGLSSLESRVRDEEEQGRIATEQREREKERLQQAEDRRVEEQQRLIEAERVEQKRKEEERIRLEQVERNRLEQQRAENERLERLEQERLEMQRLENERLKKQRIDAERLAAQRAEVERVERIMREKEEAARVRKESMRTKLKNGKSHGGIMLSGVSALLVLLSRSVHSLISSNTFDREPPLNPLVLFERGFVLMLLHSG